MENNAMSSHEEEARNLIKSFLPETSAFLKYAKPFLLYPHVRDEYEKYITILNKLEVNGIEGIAGMLSDMVDAYWKNSDGFLKEAIKKAENRYRGMDTIPSLKEFLEGYLQEFSPENVIPLASEMFTGAFNDYGNILEELDEKANSLPKEEKDIYDYFSTLIMKLWINHIITNLPYPEDIAKIFLRNFVMDYQKGMKNLYAKEFFPRELIAYIESIKIPNEDKLLSMVIDDEADYKPQVSIPVFTHADKILEVMEKYFSAGQHEALRKVFNNGMCGVQLVFKGQANQLADAFKKLFESRLITGCNKEELIKWILENFQYEGRSHKGVPLTDRYISDIISSEQKPCKNPIIEIKKDMEGKVSIFSPDRKGRSRS